MTGQAQNPDDRYTQDRNRSDNGDQNRRGRDWDRYLFAEGGRRAYASVQCLLKFLEWGRAMPSSSHVTASVYVTSRVHKN